ncbi:MAG TPA: alpha/beta fold hydrolase [Cytophagales bacterium]|jgi:pimeloyl-ACP methyl ester carboxylesterase|nr:alpha/beta fold hydrolase [Cytophagales bacterium]
MSKLFYREYGSGKPLIILHGLLGSSDNWILHGKLFARTFNVFILDQMNHGNSPHSQSINYKTLTIDLFNFIKSKNLSEVNILGHSMGGKVAMKFAIDYEYLVHKLVIVDIAPKEYPNNLKFNYIIQGIKSLNVDSISTRKEADDILSKYVSELYIRNFLLKNLKRNSLKSFFWKSNTKLIIDSIKDLYSGISNDSTSYSNVLFIKGEKSNYILDNDWDNIISLFPKAKLSTISNSGHWVHFDNPDEFYLNVMSFLK